MLEMLLKELPLSVRNALSIRVNAEKDTVVATRIVQRWRKPSNPISNTVGSISGKIDVLISAPYADKLPLKVAKLMRKNVPFAVLPPLSLPNDIKRTGKPVLTNPFVKNKTTRSEASHSDLVRSRMACKPS
jgi:hypothetical protein